MDIKTFKGFNIQYPEYEVITPQTRYKLRVRCLTLNEENAIKSSNYIRSSMMLEKVNEVIFSCIQKKEGFSTYNDFLKKITTNDRDALMYGIILISNIDKKFPYEVKCPECLNNNKYVIDLEKIFSGNIYDGKKGEFLNKTINFKVDDFHSLELKPLTLEREKKILNYIKNRNISSELIGALSFVNKIIYDNGSDKAEFEDLISIETALKQLPKYKTQELEKLIENEFNKYKIQLKTEITCLQCGYTFEEEVDITSLFFRFIYE